MPSLQFFVEPLPRAVCEDYQGVVQSSSFVKNHEKTATLWVAVLFS